MKDEKKCYFDSRLVGCWVDSRKHNPRAPMVPVTSTRCFIHPHPPFLVSPPPLAIFSHDDLATFLSSTSKISTTNTGGVRCGAPSTMLFVDIRRAHSQLRTILRQKSCAQVAGGHSKFGSSQNQENEIMKFQQ